MATCFFCGEDEHLEVLEAWGHEFQIDACCEGMHEFAVSAMNSDDPEEAKEILLAMGVEELVRPGLRRVADGGCGGLVLDWNLEIREIRRKDAQEFIRRHHDHCPPPAGDRFRAAVWNGPTLIGVTMVGRPVARALPQDAWLEVNRLCVRRDVPDALRWNACSMLYGWAAREGKRRGFEKVITYTLESEEGGTLRAAGWTDEGLVGRKGKVWNCRSRPRDEAQTPAVPKRRWSRMLAKPKRVGQEQPGRISPRLEPHRLAA